MLEVSFFFPSSSSSFLFCASYVILNSDIFIVFSAPACVLPG